MKYVFSGPLAPLIEQYLDLRGSIGLQQRDAAYTLAEFDRYLVMNYPVVQRVTRQMIVEFLREMSSRLANNTRRHRLSQLRQFCRFLFQLDGECYIPTSDLSPSEQQTIPYLYTVAEVVAIMQLAKRLKPVYPLRAESCETLIGLLWVTGLRIGEALRLNIEDVDLKQQLLQIKAAKFHKSRLVPLSTSAAQALSSYAELRIRKRSHTHSQAPFSVGVAGGRWKYETVRGTFKCLVQQLGLKNKNGREPRLHDLRQNAESRKMPSDS